MNTHFNKIKIIIIFFILFNSSIITLCTIAKSNPLDQIYACNPNLIAEYDESILKDPIIPFEEARTIPVKIKLQLIGPAVDIMLSKVSGMNLIVDMSIANVPDGCQASVTPPIVLIELPKKNSIVWANATISITINQLLPGLSQQMVTVRMKSRRFGGTAALVEPGNITQDIPFMVGYFSQLSFVYNDGNVRKITPDETADFNFEIQNWGNSATKVISKIEDLPEGWLTEIAPSTNLGSQLVGSTSSKSISLRVKPPVDFGYHEDRAIIKVSMTPINIDNPGFQGEPHYLYFIVQSKGFFTPGFETILIVFAFIFVFVPLKIRKNRENNNKRTGGKI